MLFCYFHCFYVIFMFLSCPMRSHPSISVSYPFLPILSCPTVSYPIRSPILAYLHRLCLPRNRFSLSVPIQRVPWMGPRRQDVPMKERFGDLPDSEIMDKIISTYAGSIPTDVQLAPGRFRYPWYVSGRKKVTSCRYFTKHITNSHRDNKSNEKKLRRSVRRKGLVKTARSPPIVTWSHGMNMPMQLLTWGNLCVSIYREFEETSDLPPVLVKLLESGLEVYHLLPLLPTPISPGLLTYYSSSPSSYY